MAHQGCWMGKGRPNAHELSMFRASLVGLRRAADLAARTARSRGYAHTGRALDRLATAAATANAATHNARISCRDIANLKLGIQRASQNVDVTAVADGMRPRVQDMILGPVRDDVEDVFGSGGVPFTAGLPEHF